MTTTAPLVEIVLPAHNEEVQLEASVGRLHRYLDRHRTFAWSITIAENGSTDRTWGVATAVAADLPGVSAVRVPQKGRGGALRAAWTASGADVVAYMDVDLATGLDALAPLVEPLLAGESDVAIGSRLAPGARVVRGPRREILSRVYNLVLRATLHNRFSDAQCGFKALHADLARALLPLVHDDGWFFDTELLVVAERRGLRISEVAVDWVDDPDSRVAILPTALADLAGIRRLRRDRPWEDRLPGIGPPASTDTRPVPGAGARPAAMPAVPAASARATTARTG